MNKTAIKNFAIWARVQLIEAAKQRAYEYEITENGENKLVVDTIGGRLLSKDETEQRKQLIEQIRLKGYSQVMEEAAYTWFNRFVALRFMEVNGYLPTKIRVFTDETGAFKPEILKQAMSIELEGLDRNKVLSLLDKQNNEELFKYLLITQCNALSSGLPYVFERVANWTELLFPDNLLRNESVLGRLVSDIAVDDWSDEVEIIGWLYQYYISEKHEEVVDPLRGKTVKKEDIPAATQLFTTDWVVRYILDNSLGRYWIERHPESKLAEKLAFLVMPQSRILERINENIRPEDLRVLDPCVGSGHFLSYAFDILIEIYRESGWSDRDAAKSIIENNLFGLDIDDRAAQLACFAVMMKARKYNRRIISSDTSLNIMAMQDSTRVSDELIRYVAKHDISIKNDLQELSILFNNAKEYGSIIDVPTMDFQSLYVRIKDIKEAYAPDLMEMALQTDAEELLLPLIRQAEILSDKYDIVVTNPPYFNKYSPRLKNYITEHYAAYKGDLFAVFVYRNFGLCKQNGYSGFMTPMVWMFIKTYEPLRRFVLHSKTISTLIQFEYSAFEEATVPICSFVLKNSLDSIKGCYIKLSDFRGGMDVQKEKVLEALSDRNCGYYYESSQDNYSDIPDSPIAYWLSDKFIRAFREGTLLGSIADSKQGLATADNNRFLRLWEEVDINNVKLDATNFDEANQSHRKWFPYNKGGDFRRWYGNNDYLVNWANDGYEIKHIFDEKGKLRSRPQNLEYMFRPSASWSLVSSGAAAFRYKPAGHLFDIGGMSFFSKNNLLYLLALSNTKIVYEVLRVLAPTINFQCGDIANIPVFFDEGKRSIIERIASDCISISKVDWDSFETSWDFKVHPLVQRVSTIEEAFDNWEKACDHRFNSLKANEEQLNKLFIDIYGLGDELSPDEDDKEVSVRKADLKRDIESLLSYAVGCMFGRYSIDAEGLCYAGGEWDASKYKTIIPDSDNIIPICDDDYFDDDIVGKLVSFIRKVYGEETLEQNLRFIADALGGKGTSREVIREYFINSFFSHHCDTYAVTGSGRRPIYWLFSSGKKNGFKALVYMHRYQPDLLARMRTDYVHEQQERYRTQLQILEDTVQTAAPAERVKLNKQIAKLKDQSLEIQKYEEKIHHLADQMIPVDLDDGVKVNYAKFQSVLEKVK